MHLTPVTILRRIFLMPVDTFKTTMQVKGGDGVKVGLHSFRAPFCLMRYISKRTRTRGTGQRTRTRGQTHTHPWYRPARGSAEERRRRESWATFL